MRAILDGSLKKIGYEEITKNNISNSLREEVAKWACILGSSKCREQVTLILRNLFGLNKQILLPYWKHWTYCNGLATYSTWFEEFNNYRQLYDSTILKFVACSENATAICNYLITAERYTDLQDIDRINIFHSVVTRHAKNNLILDYILTNFEKVKPREVRTNALFIDIINHVYSKEQLDKVTAFAEDYVKKKIIITSNALIDIVPYAKNSEIMKNIQERYEKLILIIKCKIETRLSEIKSHVNRYKKFVEIK